MKLFKKIPRKDDANKEVNSVGWLSSLLASAQHDVAGFLNLKTAGWSQQKKKLVLILFCLVAGNCCLYVIGKAILSDNGPPVPVMLKIHQLHIPDAAGMRHFKDIRPTDSTIQKNH